MRPWGFHRSHPDHRVARHQFRKLIFAHPLGAGGALGNDDVSLFGAAVPYPDLDVVRNLEAEILEHRACECLYAYKNEQLERVGWRFPEVIADAHFLPPQDRGEPLGTTPKYAACFVSRLAPNKGLPDLLSAWRLVRQQVPDAKLLIGGEWYSARFRQRILRLASRLKIQEVVTFAGFLTPTAKREVLEGSQIFVCPSYEEGWWMGVMEAVSHGPTPVVSDLPA